MNEHMGGVSVQRILYTMRERKINELDMLYIGFHVIIYMYAYTIFYVL